MANRRMISKDVYETDNFNEMPNSAQSLYTHYILSADDDGFIGNPKMLLRMYGANTDDLKILITKGFLIPFNDGVVAITHWKMMNNIRSDRYTATNYKDDFQKLELTDQKTYKLLVQPNYSNDIPSDIPNDNQMETSGMTTGMTNGMTSGMTSAVHRLGKDSIGKDRLDKDRYIPSDDNNPTDIYSEILKYLNGAFSCSFKPLTPTKKIIDARINDGYTVEDFKFLIDKLVSTKAIKWNTEEEKNEALRPKTLFTKDNFEKFVNNDANKVKDPFQSSENSSFSNPSKIKGIITYVNTMFSTEIKTGQSKPIIDDEKTKNIIFKALTSFNNNDRALLQNIRDNRSNYLTTDDVLEDLNQEMDLPF